MKKAMMILCGDVWAISVVAIGLLIISPLGCATFPSYEYTRPAYNSSIDDAGSTSLSEEEMYVRLKEIDRMLRGKYRKLQREEEMAERIKRETAKAMANHDESYKLGMTALITQGGDIDRLRNEIERLENEKSRIEYGLFNE